MAVKREEFCAGNRPAVFDDDMPAKIRGGFIGNGFDDLTGENGKDFVVGNKGWLVAFKILAGSAIGEDDTGGLTGRSDIDRRNVAAAMKPPAAVARPAGLAEVRIDTSPGEEFIRCSEKLPVRRRPGDDNLRVGR